jgi:glutathione S-transferase
LKGAISITEARDRGGLRLVLLEGLPSPWSQAAKGILEIEGIPYVPVHRRDDDPPEALREWTGQDSFPAAMYEDEEPRTGWSEILLLAERLAPAPKLLPADPAQRAICFGYAHEICGEMGLGWCRRLQSIARGMEAESPDPVAVYLGAKYGYREDAAARAGARVVGVLRALDALLAGRGGEYLLGELTALDVYWATFCNLVAPLPPDLLAMPEAMRPMFTASDPEALAALTPALLALRDRVYERHLRLPVEL